MLIDVVEVAPRGGHRLFVRFEDGAEGERDLADLVARGGPMVQPLKDEAYFARVFVDNGAPTWPNGYDLAPDALYEEMREAGQLTKTDAA
jgi:hypothetical protein